MNFLSIIIGASEVAEYVYCKRAWWLRRVQKMSITDSYKLQDGALVHFRHNKRVKHALVVQYCGYLLVVIGVITAIVLFLDTVDRI